MSHMIQAFCASKCQLLFYHRSKHWHSMRGSSTSGMRQKILLEACENGSVYLSCSEEKSWWDRDRKLLIYQLLAVYLRSLSTMEWHERSHELCWALLWECCRKSSHKVWSDERYWLVSSICSESFIFRRRFQSEDLFESLHLNPVRNLIQWYWRYGILEKEVDLFALGSFKCVFGRVRKYTGAFDHHRDG